MLRKRLEMSHSGLSVVSFAGLFCLIVAIVGCGSDSAGFQKSFSGETRCTRQVSFDCDCVILNSPQHQQATQTTILKCPFHENYQAAIGHEYCLNKDPSNGTFRNKLALEGCPWKDSSEEKNRLLSLESAVSFEQAPSQ